MRTELNLFSEKLIKDVEDFNKLIASKSYETHEA